MRKTNIAQYSFHARRSGVRGAKYLQNTSRTFIIQQTRSISIFGWGGSPSKPGQFASTHAPAATPQVSTDATTLSPASLEHVRSVKASHATSDAPAPSTSISTELPHTPEPTLLKNIENAIADPGGHAPVLSTNIAQIAEYKGYLKEVCGLDYGWGPTACMENALETIHIYGGQSWTVSIVGIAILYRVITAIFVYRGADQSAKMKQLMPALAPIKDEMAIATAAGDMIKRQKLAGQIQALNKEAGFSPVKMFLPILVQIPLGFGGFRLLRGCATAPVPAFLDESWLWNVDLTMGDPYYLLPALQGLLLVWTVRMSQKQGIQALSGAMASFMMVGLPAISVIWSAFQPGSVQLFFLTSTALATVQSYALSKNSFRRAVGLLPMPGNTPPSSTPSSSKLKGRLRRMPDLPGSGKIIDIKPKPTPAAPSQNRSLLDKVVDRAKSKTEALRTGLWNQTKEEQAAKIQMRRKTAEIEKAQQYEYQRKEQLQHERDIRTEKKQVRSQTATTTEPGGMRVMKKKAR
jgi:YidC/Oxa1 family membrane protein insertase